MIIPSDLPSLLLESTRAVAFLMACLAFRGGVRYKKPWRISLLTIILIGYSYLSAIPIGGLNGNPNSNPPSNVNIILNIAFSLMFWRTSGVPEAPSIPWKDNKLSTQVVTDKEVSP